MVVVADGSEDAALRLQRGVTSDPGMGVVRHADAGYPEAIGRRPQGLHQDSDAAERIMAQNKRLILFC